MRAIDGTQTGDIKTTKWAVKGIEFAYSSPIVDGTRLYQIDNGSTLRAFDIETGKELWTLPLGTAQKAPPVLPTARSTSAPTTARSSSSARSRQGRDPQRVELPNSANSCCGSEGTPEQILGGAAISRGRIFFVSSDAIYAIGPRRATSPTGFATDEPAAAGPARPAHLQVTPTELKLEPGQTVKLRARLFDAPGGSCAKRPQPRGRSRAWRARSRTARHGREQADAAGRHDQGHRRNAHRRARARVAHPLPWTENVRQLRRRRFRPGGRTRPGGSWSPRSMDRRCCRKSPRYDLPARSHVHRSADLVGLYVPGRSSSPPCPGSYAMTPDRLQAGRPRARPRWPTSASGCWPRASLSPPSLGYKSDTQNLVWYGRYLYGAPSSTSS